MKYLLDTNTVSEMMKPLPDPSVVSWVTEREDDCYLSAITVAEIEVGIALLPPGRKRVRLQEAFREVLVATELRVLGFDLEVARRWALLAARAGRTGRTLPVLDSMIEATALRWEWTVVTRNVSDFLEAPTLDPWKLR